MYAVVSAAELSGTRDLTKPVLERRPHEPDGDDDKTRPNASLFGRSGGAAYV